MKQIVSRVISNEIISAEPHRSLGRPVAKTHLIWLENCAPIAAEAHPGQFIMAGCGDECVLRRPFSIHRVDNEGNLALLFSVLADGKGTNWLAQRKPGDNIDLLGPLGNGYSLYPKSRHLLVAGGIGIAPLYFLAQEGLRKECSVILLFGTKKPDLLNRLLTKNPLPPEIKVATTSEEDTADNKGRVTDLLTPELADWADHILVSGPMPMYRDMYAQRETLLKSKPVQVSLEGIMGCGYGVCYGCTVKTRSGLKQVCSDGPVFDIEDILWDEIASEQ
ncbi:MAG: dihydroorotate dehydrogenase electron transfer subunit [Chloroflexota bacterium]